MDFVIIQICCFSCKRFENIYFTDENYLDFITSLDEYTGFSYIVYHKGRKLYEFDGWDL